MSGSRGSQLYTVRPHRKSKHTKIPTDRKKSLLLCTFEQSGDAPAACRWPPPSYSSTLSDTCCLAASVLFMIVTGVKLYLQPLSVGVRYCIPRGFPITPGIFFSTSLGRITRETRDTVEHPTAPWTSSPQHDPCAHASAGG